jgi:hypothetical protein
MEPTVHDLVVWMDDVALSAGQIQKAYDWRVAQWSTLSNAILTAIFFLVTTGLVETYKQTLKLRYFWAWVGAAVLIYGSSYLFCRLRIRKLQREFLALYTLLQEIA